MLIRTGDRIKVTELDGTSRIFKFVGVIVGVDGSETIRLASEDFSLHDMSFAGLSRKQIEIVSLGGISRERHHY